DPTQPLLERFVLVWTALEAIREQEERLPTRDPSHLVEYSREGGQTACGKRRGLQNVSEDGPSAFAQRRRVEARVPRETIDLIAEGGVIACEVEIGRVAGAGGGERQRAPARVRANTSKSPDARSVATNCLSASLDRTTSSKFIHASSTTIAT